MPPTTPYSQDLGDREAIAAIRETTDRIRGITKGWTPAQFERTYAPGKWSARLVLIHLGQTELALGVRARMALSTPNYVAQPFDQDTWIARESALGGADAVESFAAISKMNVALFASLSTADRQMTLSHPEYGSLTVDWIIHQMAGHHINHLRQLEQI
jgi:hypothetical protein